jgi:hypothetical protein
MQSKWRMVLKVARYMAAFKRKAHARRNGRKLYRRAKSLVDTIIR